MRIPIPSNEAAFFSPLSLHGPYRPLVRDPHHRHPHPLPQHHYNQLVTRRPPSPALGLARNRYAIGDIDGAINRLASRSFGYHHHNQVMRYQPRQQKRVPYGHSDWLLARSQEGRVEMGERTAMETASPPPQRIQAIVPTRNELVVEPFSRSLTT